MKTTISIVTLLFFLTLPIFADQLHTDSQAQITIPFGKSYNYNNILVKRVIDGDTIQLEDGSRVRYCGIDTPETKHPQKPVQYFGKEAYLFNKKLVEGKNVRLEFDVQQKDKYGRTLAYVYVGDTFVNAELVKQGYAQASTYPPNVKYADLFRKYEQEAREQGRGLWSDTKLAQKEDYYIASKNSQVFHRPECPYASKIASYNKVRYNSREEAVKAGKRGCSRCKP